MDSYHHRTWVEVNLDNILNNIKRIREITDNQSGIIAVVKADAYGHGAVITAKTISEFVDMFAVSSIDEAMQLRKNGINQEILILGYTPVDYAGHLSDNRLIQTVFSENYAAELFAKAAKTGKKLKIHIKLDTGMNRLGFNVQNEENLEFSIKSVKKINNDFSEFLTLDGIFTHFASSDDINNDFTELQFLRFKDCVKRLSDIGIEFSRKHVCNSAGIINYPNMLMDFVRPGIIIYGLNPNKNTRHIGLLPALEYKTVIAQIHKLNKGETVSYSQTYTAEENRILATIPVGYADGYSRHLSNGGNVLVRGRRTEIVGRVCMDQSIIDITDIPDVKEGDIVTLIGKDKDNEITASEIAERLGTINYEITCLIGKRVPRVYIKDGKTVYYQCDIWNHSEST